MATEPRTIVSIIDETIGLGNDPVDTNLNILCPIISPTGPTKLTRVTGPSMLRRFFNGGSAITPESPQSLQFARAVSAQAPLYVKRASRSEIRGGKTVTTYGTEFYVDSMGNPLAGGILDLIQKIPQGEKYTTLLTALQTPTADLAIEKTDDLVYISNSQLTGTNAKLVKKSVRYTPVKYNYIEFVGSSATTNAVKVTVNTKEYTIAAESTDLTALLTEMIAQGERPIAVSGTKVYYDQVEGTFTPVVGETEVTFIALNNTVSIDATAADEDIIVNKDSNQIFYINTIMSESEYNDQDIADPISMELTTDLGIIHIHTSDVDFDVSATIDIELDNDLSFVECCRDIYDRLDAYLTIGAKSETRFVIEGLSAVANPVIPNVDPQADPIPARLEGSLNSVFNEPTSDLFGVISKFPNNGDLITVNSIDNGNDTYTLTINAFGNEEVFTISFTPGAVDGYGNDIYYTIVEAESDYVSVIPLGGTQVLADCTLRIGGEITNQFVGTAELSATLEEMMDTEESPVLFDYILDGGVIDKSYSAMILQACEYYKSFYPMSAQTDNMSVFNMKSNRARIGSGQTACRANFIAAAQRDSVLDSGIVTMPASYYYLVTRIGLARSVKEFTAIFGQTNGNIGIINPVKDYKKSDRESMMDSQIVTLKRSMSDGSWYLNLNMTCYGTDSYLQEDGIVLMNNKISQVAMAYAETLKSEYNTPELRDQVTGTLTQMINTRLRVGTAYGPNSITVICDDTNNTKNTIAQRKLIIDIYGRFANSIKDVLIYQHVQPLEG